MYDRKSVGQVRKKLEVALAKLSIELGMNLALDGTARSSSDSITLKLFVTPLGGSGEVEPKMVIDFQKYATSVGLDPADLGRTFTEGQRVFKIVGLNPTATVNKVIVESGRGTEYVLPVDRVRRALSPQGAARERRTDAEILRDLQRVESALSPENLHMDGEASMSHVRTEGARLRRERADLVRELGREPSDVEIYGLV